VLVSVYVRVCMCVCVCLFMRVYVCVSVCVYVHQARVKAHQQSMLTDGVCAFACVILCV